MLIVRLFTRGIVPELLISKAFTPIWPRGGIFMSQLDEGHLRRSVVQLIRTRRRDGEDWLPKREERILRRNTGRSPGVRLNIHAGFEVIKATSLKIASQVQFVEYQINSWLDGDAIQRLAAFRSTFSDMKASCLLCLTAFTLLLDPKRGMVDA